MLTFLPGGHQLVPEIFHWKYHKNICVASISRGSYSPFHIQTTKPAYFCWKKCRRNKMTRCKPSGSVFPSFFVLVLTLKGMLCLWKRLDGQQNSPFFSFLQNRYRMGRGNVKFHTLLANPALEGRSDVGESSTFPILSTFANPSQGFISPWHFWSIPEESVVDRS